jgi:hypothetical protein
MNHRVRLALDPPPDEGIGAADPVTVDLAPRVLRHTDLVAPNGIRDLADLQALVAGALCDRV